MKYLKEFANNAEYEAYINGSPLTPCVSLIDDDDSVKYKQKPYDYSKDYLTFVALEDGTFKLSRSGGVTYIQYSLDDGSTWTSIAFNTNTPTVHTGEKIMWKAELTPITWNGVGTFSSTGQYEVEGNPTSLLYGESFSGQTDVSGILYALHSMFKGSTSLTSAENLVIPNKLDFACCGEMFSGCTSLVTAPELPATTLSTACYQKMFNGCTSLTSAPELPATTLIGTCYDGMFSGCTSLTSAPELPATTLVQYCYSQMFRGCSSLNYIKMLATDGLSASQCLANWVNGVASTGTFVKAASATLPTGSNGIPANWTVQNI